MSENALLFVHALTGLHPGSGTALGAVDLPVQRERHTQWPTIPASSLKGVLRDACRKRDGNGEELWAVFGPETANAEAHAGAVSVTDARILAFPVRSLSGVFAWATCPAVLQRLKRDLALTNGISEFGNIPALQAEQAACRDKSPLLVDGNKLVLEEFEFARTGDAGDAAAWIAAQATTDEATRRRIDSHLAIIDDDAFTYLVRHATEVVARIGLDYARKTVRAGALFYEEFLPAETIFYAVVLAEESRRKTYRKGAREVMNYLSDHMPPVLQIGANETIGKGLCAMRLVRPQEVSA